MHSACNIMHHVMALLFCAEQQLAMCVLSSYDGDNDITRSLSLMVDVSVTFGVQMFLGSLVSLCISGVLGIPNIKCRTIQRNSDRE